MAAIRYFIKRKGGEPLLLKDGTISIYLKYMHAQKHVLFKSGVRINPEQWVGDADQAKPVVGIGSALALSKLNKKRGRLAKIVDTLEYEKIDPTIETVRHKWRWVKPEQQRSEELADMLDAYIENGRTTKNERTVKIAERVRKDVIAYCKKKRLKPKVQDVNLAFYEGLQAYFVNDRKLSTNSVGKYLQHFKSAMRWADRNEYTVSTSIQHFEIPTMEMPVVFLTSEEIDRLFAHDFKTQRLNRVRDLWVLQASIGLRWSDLERLSKSHVKSDVIRMKSFKTNKQIVIPLSPRARGLLAKLDYSTTFISQQKFNSYIKECVYLSGIEREVEIPELKRGKKRIVKTPVHELVSSHTAVKSFITNAIAKGVSLKAVATATGRSMQVLVRHYYGSDEYSLVQEMTKAFEV